MTLTLAHFSDVHLGPVTAADVFGAFRLKRLVGGCSWHFKRKALHNSAIADALRADILAADPSHICFTGDLVNISARREFERGQAWLAKFGNGDRLSFVPGNHDAYVKATYRTGLGLLEEYMRGEGKNFEKKEKNFFGGVWPTVKLRRNLAIVGVSSAVPQNLWKAGGTLGQVQREALGERLAELGAKGFYRVLMIHHPPLPGLARNRKALTDAVELQDVLVQAGVELVLHGHNHRAMFNSLNTATGVAHIMGVPSASMVDAPGHESAQWHGYRISRTKGHWQTQIAVRVWSGTENRFKDGPNWNLGEEK